MKVKYKQSGSEKMIEADFCICTIPLPVLSNIENNFQSETSRAIDFVPYINTGKMGYSLREDFGKKMNRSMAALHIQTMSLHRYFILPTIILEKKEC